MKTTLLALVLLLLGTHTVQAATDYFIVYGDPRAINPKDVHGGPFLDFSTCDRFRVLSFGHDPNYRCILLEYRYRPGCADGRREPCLANQEPRAPVAT